MSLLGRFFHIFSDGWSEPAKTQEASRHKRCSWIFREPRSIKIRNSKITWEKDLQIFSHPLNPVTNYEDSRKMIYGNFTMVWVAIDFSTGRDRFLTSQTFSTPPRICLKISYPQTWWFIMVNHRICLYIEFCKIVTLWWTNITMENHHF